jgi:hypothetical protein
MTDAAAPKIGRPSTFSPDLALTICQRIARGDLLMHICEEPDMPDHSTVYRWLEKDGAFREAYTRARRDQADWFVEDTVHISDTEPDPNRARVRVQARQWVAERLNASKYGAKMAVTGHDGGPLAIQVVRFDLPAPELKDVTPGAKVLEHVAAHAPQAPDQTQAIDKTEDDKS